MEVPKEYVILFTAFYLHMFGNLYKGLNNILMQKVL